MTKPKGVLSTRLTPALECPVCHRVLNAATAASLDPADPTPTMGIGDITACAYCGTILCVTTLGFRPATDAEIDSLSAPLRALLFDYVPFDTPKAKAQ